MKFKCTQFLIIIALLFIGCAHNPSGSPASGFFRQGMTLFNTGNIEQAAIEFRKANAADPLFAPAYSMLGRVYLDKGDTYRAEMFFRKSLALDDSNTEIYGWIGDIYWHEGNEEKAMEFYERCPDDDPHYAVLHFRIGMRAYQSGKSDDARSEFEKALRFPEYWGGHYGLGILACADGFYDEAIANFKKARNDSAECDISFWLGKSYLNLDKEPQAYLYYRRFCNNENADGELKKEAERTADLLESSITNPDSGTIDTSLVIPFRLETVTDLNVGVCDMEGQVVKYLFQGSITRGDYTLTWDGTTSDGDRADGGIYLGFIESNDDLEVYPIILQK